MGYAQLRKNLIEFDQIIERLSLSIEEGSLLRVQFDVTRDFLADEANVSEKELLAKWTDRLKEFYDSQIVVNRLIDAVLALKDQSGLKKTLRRVLAGSIVQDFELNQAKDYFYELEMAMLLKNAGFAVELREPDIVISENGLTQRYGIACKNLSSEKQIHDHLSKGYKQISDEKLKGFVMLGVEQIAFKDVFKEKNGYMDVRNLDESKLMSFLEKAAIQLKNQRTRDYPSEHSIDAAIITLSFSGIHGKPAALMTYRAMTHYCDIQNPMVTDIKLIASRLNNE